MRGVLELFPAKSWRIGEGGGEGLVRAVTADFVRNPFLARPQSRQRAGELPEGNG